ncbi:MAG: 2,3-bisphosphoglycerate-independent phosphoglycerate mutase [Anaerolineaceae bacterium]|nr:2,3-bisphosphoglycerate-independent phosphoglycerate mutase [Anaerolineaceae bacterium]
MTYSNITSLLTPANTKIVLLVMDGLGGLPMQSGGLTELETAKTPNMDRLAAGGMLGQTNPIDFGITPGSGPAHLSLFGYDPVKHEVGRGVLEALGVGMYVHRGDVAVRGNFCTIDGDGIISDRRAGRISSEDAAPLIEKLKAIRLPGVEIETRHVKEYRFAVVFRGEGLSPDLDETDPQRTGVAPLPVVARNPEAQHTADLFNQWIAEAKKILADQPKANCLTLRGFATDPRLAHFKERYNLRAACVAVYPMYKGVSSLVGMDIINVEGETPADEFAAVERIWNDYDFIFVHIKKTDSYGEDGNFDGKVHVIETVDEALPHLLKLNPDVLIITGDHSTPCKLKSHSWHPVPFLLSAPATIRSDDQTQFGERACARGGLGTINSLEAMPLALAHAQRLTKFGA